LGLTLEAAAFGYCLQVMCLHVGSVEQLRSALEKGERLLNATLWLGSVWDVFQYFDKRALVRNKFTGINGERFRNPTLGEKDFPTADRLRI